MLNKLLVPILIGGFMLSGCGVKKNDPESYHEYVSYFENLTIDSLTKKIENNQSFTVYIGRDDCPYCQIFVPKLYEAMNSVNAEILYLDTNKETNVKALSDFTQEYNILYVPSLLKFEYSKMNALEIDSENITIEEIELFLQ